MIEQKKLKYFLNTPVPIKAVGVFSLVASMFLFAVVGFSGFNVFFHKNINPNSIIQLSIIKQTTAIVANGSPVKWTMLVKKSDVASNQYLAKLPKGAKNIKIQSVTAKKANDILKSKPIEQLSLQQRQQIAAASSKNQNFFMKAGTILFGDLQEAIDNAVEVIVENLTDQDITHTQDATIVDLSSQIVQEEPVEGKEEIKEEKKENKEEQKEEKQEEKNEEKENGKDGEAEEVGQDEIIISETPVLETVSESNQPIVVEEPIVEETPATESAPEPEVAPAEESTPAAEEFVAVDFETPSPTITEQATDTGKIVTVSAENEDPNVPLTDVLASTTIPEIYKVGQESKIKIKWKTGPSTGSGHETDMPFHAYDTNNNGKLDYVEWTIPHLSDQIFEIIFISKAFQLDQDQNIISDIYDTAATQDQNYATVPSNNYVRTTFNSILNNNNDITIYAKPTDPNTSASVKVFPVYADGEGNQTQGPELVLTPDNENPDFSNINQDAKYRVLLTNLQTPTDIFDLQVIGGSIDFDLIIDPASHTWDGGGDNDNVSTAANWVDDSAPEAGDDIIFSGSTRLTPVFDVAVNYKSITFSSSGFSATVNQDIALTGGITVANAATISVASGKTLSVATGVTFTALLTKTGAGTLTLSATGSGSGGISLEAGTLNINNNTALGTGIFQIGATTGSTAVTFNVNAALSITNAITIYQDFTFTGSNTLSQATGGITLYKTPTMTVSASTLTFGGVVDDGANTYAITKAGAGTLALSGANTFGGAGQTVTISGGALSVLLDNTLGNASNTVTLNGGQLFVAPGCNYARNFTINDVANNSIYFVAGGGIYTDIFSGVFSGPGSLAFTGPDPRMVYSLTNPANSFGGSGKTVTVSNASIVLSGNYSLGDSNNSVTLSNGHLWAATNVDIGSRAISIGTSGGILSAADNCTLTSSGAITGSQTLTINQNPRPGSIYAPTATSTVVLNGDYSAFTGAVTHLVGILKLGGTSLSGANEIAVGTAGGNVDTQLLTTAAINIGRPLRIPTSNTTDTGTRVVTIGGDSAHASTFSGNIFLGTTNQAGRGVTLTAASGGTATFSGVIQNPSGMDATTYTVTKAGTGTATLSGVNSYTGATSISAGILKLGATGSGANSPLGTVDGSTSVTANAALDLAGYTLATAEALTLNGTGVSSGGALMNSGSAATYSGLVTLGSTGVSIVGGTGTIALSNAGNITGSGYNLTLGGAQGGSVASIIGTGAGALTKADAGAWTLSGANTYTGGTTISAGALAPTNADALGTGSMTLGASGTLNASGASNLNIGGNWINNGGAFTSGANTITLNGTNQKIVDPKIF